MTRLENALVGIGERPALLVVDPSVAFTDPNCPLGTDFDAEIRCIARLLSLFRAHNLPVYFTTVIYRDDGQAKVFRTKLPALALLQEDSPLVGIDPRVAPLKDEAVLVKRWPSAFFGTDLAERMKRSGVDTVFVVGFSTSGCVRASVVDSLSSDFRTIVVADGCGDRDRTAHDANLYDMAAKYADVITLDATEQVIKKQNIFISS